MKKFELWIEGYASSDGFGKAFRLGEFEGDNFDEAVMQYNLIAPETQAQRDKTKSIWKIWGCRLFDNEADAMKSFG